MPQPFSSSFFVGNRKRLRARVDESTPIVLSANGLLQRNGDVTYSFSQDPSFWYFSGCDEPDVILVSDVDEEYLIMPRRSVVQQTMEGDLDIAAIGKRAGISTVLDQRQGWQRLKARLQKVGRAATLLPSPRYVAAYGLYTNPSRQKLMSHLKLSVGHIELSDIRQHIARLRMIKQDAELVAMQTAIDITVKGLTELFGSMKGISYHYEYELEAELTRGFRRQGASDHAFPPMIASGLNACTAHSMRNDAALAKGELLLCDVGALFDHYTADITRTIAPNGPTKRQTAIHQSVLEVQEFALSLLKPNVVLKQYEQQVEQRMGEKLRALGLITTNDRTAIRQFFPYGTSHFLGLSVHDIGLYDEPLQAGMVLTVEPGIHVPKEAIGVRIEDDILITATGHQILSKALPRSLNPADYRQS